MAHAHYRVTIPTRDAVGNWLHPSLPSVARKWLTDSNPRAFYHTWVEGPHPHDGGESHHLITVAPDRPESDGLVKQLDAHIGDLSNHAAVSVIKHGSNGPEPWVITNPNHQEGQPAAQSSLAPSVASRLSYFASPGWVPLFASGLEKTPEPLLSHPQPLADQDR